MKKLLASLLLLTVAHSGQITGVRNRKVFPAAGGGISFLAKGCSGTSSTTALACSGSITSVPSGATLLIWISDTVAGTVTVTDTGSHASLAVVSGYPCTYHSGGSQGTIWIETGAASGTHSISATVPTGGGQIVVVAASGGAVDVSTGTGSTCASAFGTTATTASITTTHTNDLAFMFVGDTGGAATYTFASTPINLSSSGFPTFNSDAGFGTITTATTTNGVATLASSNQWTAELVALH